MAGLICCLWWFLAGVLLGWLANWLFNKFFRRGGDGQSHSGYGSAPPSSPGSPRAPAPQSFAAPIPVPAAATATASAPVSGSASALGSAALASAAAALGFSKLKSSDGYDNFEIIEGIGPKINEVLHNAGVHSFAALGAMDIPGIAKILDAAGPNFKLANPETWAQQAGLCADGHWEKLKAWQDELVAGVSIKKDNA